MSNGWAYLADMASGRLATPYGTNDQLAEFTWAQLFGTDSPDLALSRAQAMQLAPVARARHLICSTGARLPLEVLGRDGSELDPQPSWLNPWQPDGLPAFHRMLWTLDDLLFYGHSVWQGELGADGFPLRMDRLPMDAWQLQDGRLTDADGQPLPARGTVYIPGPHEGILTFAQESMRLARDLSTAAREQAARPFRLELHQTSDAALSRAERRELVTEARDSLRTNGGVLFTNPALEAKVHQLNAGDLITSGREASARDLARHADVPAGMVDAPAGDSMTYATVASRLREFLTFGLASYVTAVTARLSMQDVTPRGTSVVADSQRVLRELGEDVTSEGNPDDS